MIEEKEASALWTAYSFGEKVDPVWAPDSEKLALAINNGIFIIGRDAKRIRRINIPTMIGDPTWAPDSLKIACAGYENRKGTNIYVFSIKDDTVTQITNGKKDYNPMWANVKN